jgi:hypothetical protein
LQDSIKYPNGPLYVWIAPEIHYNIQNRGDFWGSYELPQAVDPGSYVLKDTSEGCELYQEMVLEVYNTIPAAAKSKKSLTLRRLIQPTPDPLRESQRYRQIGDGITYAGYVHKVTLAEEQSDEYLSETWTITQLNAGGTLYIPASPDVEYVDHLEPIADEHLSITNGGAVLRITGSKMYKVS